MHQILYVVSLLALPAGAGAAGSQRLSMVRLPQLTGARLRYDPLDVLGHLERAASHGDRRAHALLGMLIWPQKAADPRLDAAERERLAAVRAQFVEGLREAEGTRVGAYLTERLEALRQGIAAPERVDAALDELYAERPAGRPSDAGAPAPDGAEAIHTSGLTKAPAAVAAKPSRAVEQGVPPGPPVSEGTLLELDPGYTRVYGLRFSPDKKTVAGVIGQSTVLWDSESGQVLFEQPWHELVKIRRDGSWVMNVNVYNGRGAMMKIFDPRTRAEKIALPGAFEAEMLDDVYLISTPEGHAVLDLKEGARPNVIEGRPVMVSADKSRILTIAEKGLGLHDARVRFPKDLGQRGAYLFVDRRSGKTERFIHGAMLRASADLSRVVFERRRRLRGEHVLVDSASGKELASWRGASYAQFSPGGRWLALAPKRNWGALRMLRIVSAASGREVLTARGQWPAAFSPDERLVVTRGGYGRLHLWDLDARREIGTLDGDRPIFADGAAGGPARLATFVSANGRLTAHFWDAATGRHLDALELGAQRYQPRGFVFDAGWKHLIVEPPNMWAPYQLWDLTGKRLLRELYSEEPLRLSDDWALAASAHIGRAAVHRFLEP